MSTSSGKQSASGGGADPAPKPSRRVFSQEYKLAMVAEYENAPNGLPQDPLLTARHLVGLGVLVRVAAMNAAMAASASTRA